MSRVTLYLIMAAGSLAPIAVASLLQLGVPSTSRHEKRGMWTVLISSFGCGFLAVGVATLLVPVVARRLDLGEWEWFTVLVPLTEEPLKAVALVVALGTTVVVRGDRLGLRRCALATVGVVAGFAAGENVVYLVSALAADPVFSSGMTRAMATLQVRVVLPPLGHLAETWPVGAAIWLAGRHRTRWRLAVLVVGVAIAIPCHVAWNASALRWWPDPWPLIALLMVSLGAAAGFCLTAARLQHREGELPPTATIGMTNLVQSAG